jgi:hypothetical protein
MKETRQLMLDQLSPEDKLKEDTPHHSTIREQTKQQIHTLDDKEFTVEEVRQVIEGLQPKKTPGPNGITNEIIKLVFKVIPITMTGIYNGLFPRKLESSKNTPNSQTGKGNEHRNI